MKRRRLPVHPDDRGLLIPVELGDLGFPIERVFVVTGSTGVVRGDHLVPCRQVLLLVSGTVTVTVGPDSDSHVETLNAPGDAVELTTGEYVRYRLADAASTLVVFAEKPYRRAPETA
jgi:hypothetical protein